MPVFVDANIPVIGEAEFHRQAHQAIGLAFDLQNEFGSLLSEATYSNLLVNRLSRRGLAAKRETQITCSFGDFQKLYFIDILTKAGLLVEAKTVDAISPAHIAQTLNYVLLANLHHGLIINFRGPKVSHHYVSTTLTRKTRSQFRINQSGTDDHVDFVAFVESILSDWGTHLQTALYRDAFATFQSARRSKINICDGTRSVGTEEHILLDGETALAVTSLTTGIPEMRRQFLQFISHASITRILWVNMNQSVVEISSVPQS